MKIVFVVNELNFFLRTHINLAKRISEFHEVSLIADTSKSTADDLDTLKRMGISLHILNRKRNANKALSYFSFIFSLTGLIKRINPKYIFYITLELSFFGSLISYFLRVKKSIYIVTGLGPFFFRKDLKYKIFDKLQHYSFLLTSILKKNFLFIFLNYEDMYLLCHRYKIKESNCQLIHGEGIDELEFRYIEREQDVPKFLLASRLVQSKGIEDYMACAKKIKQHYSQAQFAIAGIYDPYNPESIATELFEEIKLSEDILFLGEISHNQMEECFHKNNIFVLPSEREGLPKAAAEAASTGMPLILSDVPGCQECVIDGETGRLISDQDRSELYDAMESFILDAGLISTMGKKSAEFAKKKFSLGVIEKQYLDIISKEKL
jgi:glycosyltransferase involved in cell wall biosynthesis